MEEKLRRFYNIDEVKKKEEIIKLTANQIIKDFGVFGMEVNFSGIVRYAYDELYKQLEVFIDELMNRNPEKLQSLLYHIDLNEKDLRALLYSDELSATAVTEKVLDREFFKVLTRIYFKEQGI